MIKKKSTLTEWQNRLRSPAREEVCLKCGRNLYLTVDHIIPVHMLTSLNLEEEIYQWEDNFQVLCYACNKFKSGTLDISNPKTLRLLKEAIVKAESQIIKPI